MFCPHHEPCKACREFERGQARTFAWICAILAPLVAVVAVACALELDPRASAWIGFAIGCVLMCAYNVAESRRSA